MMELNVQAWHIRKVRERQADATTVKAGQEQRHRGNPQQETEGEATYHRMYRRKVRCHRVCRQGRCHHVMRRRRVRCQEPGEENPADGGHIPPQHLSVLNR